jgi:hypothetical protein
MKPKNLSFIKKKSSITQFSHVEKLLLYIIGKAERLIAQGFIKKNEDIKLTGRGKRMFQELEASGFLPTENELRDTIDGIQLSLLSHGARIYAPAGITPADRLLRRFSGH